VTVEAPANRVEELLRELAPQVLGALLRRFRDFERAEDATQEALLAAALQWPSEGLPENPRAWLIQIAFRRMTDQVRSESARRRREDAVAVELEREEELGSEVAAGLGPDGDDTPILLFMSCHPSLTPSSAIALTLRAVGGLSTAEIAKAFLVPEATMAQRIAEGVTLVSAALSKGAVGPYQLQAAIAAVHDEAPSAAATDWPQILALYEVLERMSDNPMVMLNRAIAIAMVQGPRAGLERLDALDADGRLGEHHRLAATRAHLLEMAGEPKAAIDLYRAAASRTTSLPEQRYLLARAARLKG
jgi:RNA polymerase sigma factor (sigma-70 family)